MVDGMEPGRLVLFPQLLLATVAVLPVPYVHVFVLVMDLFSKVGWPSGTAWLSVKTSYSCKSSSGCLSLCDVSRCGQPLGSAGDCCIGCNPAEVMVCTVRHAGCRFQSRGHVWPSLACVPQASLWCCRSWTSWT